MKPNINHSGPNRKAFMEMISKKGKKKSTPKSGDKRKAMMEAMMEEKER